MEKINVNISWCEGNYGASSMDVLGCIAAGNTLEEVKAEYADALKFHIEGCDPGEVSEDLRQGNYELVFKPDVHALLNHYKGKVSYLALAKATGINAKQLGHYAQGVRTARPKQRERIIDGLHRIGDELLNIV